MNTIQAVDGAGEDGSTLYVLSRTGQEPITAYWPQPLLELCPDAVRIPTGEISCPVDVGQPVIPSWESFGLSDEQRESARSLRMRHLRCEDCGEKIDVDNYRPLDLMRPQRGSSGKRVWDATKQKWVRRPAQGPKKRARRNGRRFRVVDLCRKCAGEALRQRAAKGTSVMENGKRRTLATKERIAPKRGGRPRLFNDDELRKLHFIYENSMLSRREIARRLVESRGGSMQGYEQAMYYGWKRLSLPMYGRSEGLRRAHATKSWTPAKCAHPGCHYWGDMETGYCVHHHLEKAA